MRRDFLFFVSGIFFTLYMAYSGWRIYWLASVGAKGLVWHSILWLYLSVLLLLTFVVWLFYLVFQNRKELVIKLGSIVIGSWVVICLFELLIRVTQIKTEYSELRMGYFLNPLDSEERIKHSWYWTYLPNSDKFLNSGDEFTFGRHTNSIGLSDYEWQITKDSNQIRILTLGDSFTEGDGAAYEDSYPVQLRQILGQTLNGKRVEVMNAGVCGSDPYFEFKLLEGKLLKYKPDIVLFTVSHGDLYHDHSFYGGMERFNPKGTLNLPQKKEFWMNVFAVSHIFRIVRTWITGNESVLNERTSKQTNLTTFAESRALNKRFNELAVEHNFKCIQLLRPEKGEFTNRHYDWNPDSLFVPNLSNFTTFDLLKFYKDSIKITEDDYEKYYWQQDGHHNAAGYKIMAKAVAEAVKQVD